MAIQNLAMAKFANSLKYIYVWPQIKSSPELYTHTHTPHIFTYKYTYTHIYIHNKQMCIHTYIHLFIKKNISLKKEAKGYKQKNIGDRGCLGRVFYFR